MNLNYHFQQFNHDKNYYFYDGERYFEISKSISTKDFQQLNSKYYLKSNSRIFEYLFDGKDFPYHYKFYKFLVIYLSKLTF